MNIPTGASIETKSDKRKEEYAELTYAEYRNRKEKSDILMVSNASGLSEDEIEKIRFHLFENKSLKFADGTIGGFEANWKIAWAWQRMERGECRSEDLILLKHEYKELTLMMEKHYPYEKAHLMSNFDYPWEYIVNEDESYVDDEGELLHDRIQASIKDRINCYIQDYRDDDWYSHFQHEEYVY